MITGAASSSVADATAGVFLSLRQVSKAFEDNRAVIQSMNLEIPPGEFLAILGPSGCGKSTLLRIIARLLPPDGGEVRVSPDEPFQTSFVFQDAHLLPWRNVLENVALPLELMGASRPDRNGKALEALVQVGLGDAVNLYPGQLSGGMRMRASLARALVTNPKLLLLDEPFAALDEMTRFHLDAALRQLWLTRGLTVIFVTHSISEAAFLANRAVVLTRRGGLIKMDRAIHLPQERNSQLRLDTRFAAEMNVLASAMEEE